MKWDEDSLMRVQIWTIKHYFPFLKPHPIKINYRITKYYARAGQELEFFADYLEYATLKMIRKTMIHELMHYEMSRLANILLTEKYNADVSQAWKDVEYRKLCGIHNREFQKRLYQIKPQSGTWKYIYKCACGSGIKRIKRLPQNKWICNYCGATIKGKKNF